MSDDLEALHPGIKLGHGIALGPPPSQAARKNNEMTEKNSEAVQKNVANHTLIYRWKK